jgi:hypothetical protein
VLSQNAWSCAGGAAKQAVASCCAAAGSGADSFYAQNQCEQVEARGTGFVAARCPAGKVVLTGGCNSGSAVSTGVQTSATEFLCGGGGPPANKLATAICCAANSTPPCLICALALDCGF